MVVVALNRTHAVGWGQAVEDFLTRRDLAPGSRRVYRLTLERVGHSLGDPAVEQVTPESLGTALLSCYPEASAATWNRHVATIRSFWAFVMRQGWADRDVTAALERRRVHVDHDRALSRETIERLVSRRDVPVRDRCLWRMLYETAARAEEVLRLNVEDLDLARKRATIVRKGGDSDVVHWQSGTARLLPYVIGGRSRGPLFLASRPPAPTNAPASSDLDPVSGHARLSYRQAAAAFKAASGGATLHQLRHSALTHLAEEGVPLPLLMAKSRHQSLRTLQRYVHPSVEAVAAVTAAHDPARRR